MEIYRDKLSETSYNMADEPLNAALFTTGNGYIGVRGSYEEFGSLRIQGAYIRGLIDEITEIVEPFCDNEYMKHYYIDEVRLKHFEKQESIINFSDILLLRFEINGEVFYPWEGEVVSWERYIDIKRACLVRNVTWKSPNGLVTQFKFERFASSDSDNMYCIKACVKPVNYSSEISVVSGFDTRVKTNGQHITKTLKSTVKENTCYTLTSIGEKYNFTISSTAKTNIYGADATWDIYTKEDDIVATVGVFKAQQGVEYTVEKNIYIISSRETQNLEPQIPDDTYEQYYQRHIKAYSEILSAVDCVIEGDTIADGTIRFSNYHSIIAIPKNDSIHGLSAKGITGEKYNNFVWWDSEIYQLPIYIYTMPTAAKNAIMYRYNMLNSAKNNAKLENKKGARFAFCSSVAGDERVWEYARHPFMQIHITADVAFGVIHYYTATEDKEFLKDYGMEILTECCRYWADVVEYVNDRYELKRMTGTDEHHPYVDNDAYTNYLVKYILERTSDYCKMFAIYEDEAEKWIDISKKMYLPMEKNKLIPQFDGYFDLSRTLEEAGNGASKSFQMKTSGLYNKSQIIKQPDVMLLFSYLNFNFDKDVYAINWDYYEQMCESSSSLSFAPHSICAADNNRMLSAYNYLLDSAMVDINDIFNCGWQGIHSGSAAGAWYAVFRGIGGIVCREDCIEINPHMIPWWKNLTFSFVYRGIRFSVNISDNTYSIKSDSSKDVKVIFKGKEFIINNENEVRELL